MSWITCVVDSDYEIYTEYPYPIRRKYDGYIISERKNRNNYYCCELNKKHLLKHRIIALQFINNDDIIHKNEVDHMDGDRTNNHISNLRWVSRSENQRNKLSHIGYKYTYVNNIDDECIKVDTYNNYRFEDYYFDAKTDKFYFFNGIKYREQPIRYSSVGKAFVQIRDINNKRISIYYSVFKKQYGLI